MAKCPVGLVKLDVPILTTMVCDAVTLLPMPYPADIIDSPPPYVKSAGPSSLILGRDRLHARSVQMTDVGWNANAYGDYIDPTLQGNGCAQPYLSVTTKRPNVSFSITPALSNTENYGSGLYTAPAIADLNDDGFMDMVVGNMNGGLTYYSGKVYDVGIDEIPAKEIPSLNVYPNPGHGKFTIAAPYTGNTKLAVYDLNGRLVLSKEVTQNETQINLENQPVGIYLFIMQNEDGLRSAKVLKQ